MKVVQNLLFPMSDKETQQATKADHVSASKTTRATKKKPTSTKKGKPKAKSAARTTKKSSSTKKKQQRPYPKVTIERALQVAIKIKELNGGNPWTPADIADAIEIGPRSPDFYYVTAASRDFGITTGTRDTATIELTDLGREIAYAPSKDAESAKKIEAFHSIDLFARVLKHYKGSVLPEMKYLGNTLTREFDLAEEHHQEFAQVFRDNCAYLGITAGDSEPAGETPLATTVVVGETTKTTKLKAFVIMPFVERNPDRAKGFFSEVLRSLVTPAGVNAGFTVETANRQGSDVIQSTIINDLLEADLVIADLTDHNPNVLFELGLRMAADRPVALIKAAGTGKVFDVDNMLRVFEYQPQLWTSTLESDTPKLAQHVSAAWENREKHPSYIKILRRAGDHDTAANESA